MKKTPGYNMKSETSSKSISFFNFSWKCAFWATPIFFFSLHVSGHPPQKCCFAFGVTNWVFPVGKFANIESTNNEDKVMFI